MRKIILISCVSKKLDKRAKAKDLYISPLFKYNLKYAQSMNPDKIFILSAKYGLLKLDEEIDTYNETLNTKSSAQIKVWANNVLTQLKNEIDINNDTVIFLAGEKYRKNLTPFINNYEVPMRGLSIGKQLQFLKERVK